MQFPASVALLCFLASLPSADCKKCIGSAVPEYGAGTWSPFGCGATGVVVEFLEAEKWDGQCGQPAGCGKADCKYAGTLRLHNGSGFNLLNGQIEVGGAVVGGSGALPAGGTRSHVYTQDAPLKVECRSDQDVTKNVVFSITFGQPNGAPPLICTSTLQLTCSKCR